MEDNNGSDNSSTFLPDNGHLRENFIPDNIDISSNKIPKSIDSVLPSLLIAGKKYRIWLGRTYTTTNITIQKITERIESTTNLEVTDNKGVINSLIKIKRIVIVVFLGLPF